MALLSWFETMGASDCFSGHTTWNDMTNYIKHSACTDFTIHSTCTDTGQAFRFTYDGTYSTMYGGTSTGNDMKIQANDDDTCPFIKLLGDSDVEIQVELGDFFWFYENALKTIRFSRDSNDCQIKGGDNTLRHLSLWANTIDPYPYIKLDGSGDIDFHYNTARGIFFYEQANERFKFYEHSIDFNNDRAIYINDDETYIGHGAGDNIIGIDNTAVGKNALNANASRSNAAFGCNTLTVNTSYSNVAVGCDVLASNTTGHDNIAMGRGAGNNVVDKSACIYLGSGAGKNNAASNRLYINNSDSAFPLIYGEFDNDVVAFGDNSAAWNIKFVQSRMHMKETTTPGAIANYGAIYCKADNKLYFQDGAGVEKEIAFV